MGFRRGTHNLNIQQQETIVNGRAEGRTHLELWKQFNISESGISKFLNTWVDSRRHRHQIAGLNGRRPVKKSMISTKNRKAQVEWAKTHKDWTKKEWEDVLWSDENKYILFGTDGIQWIRRPQGTRFDPKY
ncbi:Transposable element Tcb1 transposase [Araneus ventricosus]|uniref:Transposable element Tcb1 transposase n=1 Tax=Araneus ventricosus TaxID=182803 RepID=A0A4Y2I259_ARAVE|nr:Transposable element Tcb1 transposase [Araneus ventricosus]